MKLQIKNLDKTILVQEGESILDTLRRERIDIRSSCGGYASCSDCIVKVLSNPKLINSVTFDEKKLLGNVFHITKERLACQVKDFLPENLDDPSIEIEIVNLD